MRCEISPIVRWMSLKRMIPFACRVHQRERRPFVAQSAQHVSDRTDSVAVKILHFFRSPNDLTTSNRYSRVIGLFRGAFLYLYRRKPTFAIYKYNRLTNKNYRFGIMRFSDIQRTIGDISQRMLTVTLRSLETDGMPFLYLYRRKPTFAIYKYNRLTNKNYRFI